MKPCENTCDKLHTAEVRLDDKQRKLDETRDELKAALIREDRLKLRLGIQTPDKKKSKKAGVRTHSKRVMAAVEALNH